MIVPMSHLTVLCLESEREAALSKLRDLGVLHITAETAASTYGADSLAEAEAALSAAKRALEIAKEAQKLNVGKALPPSGKALPPEEVTARKERVDALSERISSLEKEIALYSNFGDFDPSQAEELIQKGIPVTLFRAGMSSEPQATSGVVVKILARSESEKAVYGVAFGDLGESAQKLETIPLPPRALSVMVSELAAAKADLAEATASLAACAASAAPLSETLSLRTAERDFRAAAAKSGAESGIAWITGFCPEEDVPAIRAKTGESGWGIATRAPLEEENPPTLLRPPRIFRPITSLFRILDVSPGYRENDVSVVFYAFFTLFFAMLVGDFGYGLLMLAATVWARRKFASAPTAPFILLTVFSAATCVWGILSCNYFGAHPAALDFAVPKWLNEPSYANIMQLCFMLGAIHLSIARLWTAVLLWPDSKALAEIGWTGVIWTMYCTSCTIVIPAFVFPRFMYAVACVAILLIFLFMLKREELKTEGINLAILPLNIMSCLGDIISYVRLFAVGLAAVKLAENFNSMAFGMSLPLIVKIPVVAVILLLGHGLNLAMGALSILVHAVRLNTLEFSSHKGVSWSGYAYEPFKR